MTNTAVLALDVGGTNLRAALVESGRVLHRDAVATNSTGLHGGLAHLITGLLHKDAAAGVKVVGVGVPEYVRDGRVTSAEVVDWTAQTPELIEHLVASMLGRRVGVVVDADVRCGAVAEHARLARPDRMSLLYVSWGTGVSSTLVLPGGWAWAGARGEALALGEWRDDAGRRLEDVASGGGMRRRYTEVGGEVLDAVAIHRRAKAGDAAAQAVFHAAGTALGTALHRLIDVLDPHAVVVGGGLGTTDHLGRTVLFGALSTGRRPGFPSVRPAHHGADAGLIGAALLALSGSRATT